MVLPSRSGYTLFLNQQERSSSALSYPLRSSVKAVGKMLHHCINEISLSRRLVTPSRTGDTVVKMLRWERAVAEGEKRGKSLFGDVTPLRGLAALSLSDPGETLQGGVYVGLRVSTGSSGVGGHLT